jgi:AcrR family transcriptional regulator
MARAAPLPPTERRELLLAAAREVFAERGYFGASVSDILERANVARGTFYNHFESKRDVFAAVLAQLMIEVLAPVAPIEVSAPIAPQVRANLHAITCALAEAGDAVRILFTDAGSVDREGEAALAAFYAHALARAERALETGQAMGVVRASETRQTARCLLGCLREPVMQARLAGEPLDAPALAEAIFSLLEAGVFVAPGELGAPAGGSAAVLFSRGR